MSRCAACSLELLSLALKPPKISIGMCPSACHNTLLCSEELIVGLVRDVNTAAALDALPLVAPTPRLCAAAIRAAAQRGSLRGVRALLRHAFQVRVALGPQGADVWRAAIVAFGQLKRPEDARQAFVDMRVRARAWDTDDTPTVNLLLNALASDIKLQFIR